MLQGVLFVLAGAFLFGLTGFLFRDEIPRERCGLEAAFDGL